MEFAYQVLMKTPAETAHHEILPMVRDAGFEKIAMSFMDNDLFLQPNWERVIQELREEVENLGLRVEQTHLTFYPLELSSEQKTEEMELILQRSVQATAIMGAEWGAYHPRTAFSDNCSVETGIKDNKETLLRMVEVGEKYNAGVAVENIPLIEYLFPGQHVFGSDPHELCELVDQIDSDKIGICWDTGHGHLMEKLHPQVEAMHLIGSRLKATHLHDNNGFYDSHAVPGTGSMDWAAFMKAVEDIHYTGSMTFEVRLPKYPEAWKPFIEMTYATGVHMRQWWPGVKA